VFLKGLCWALSVFVLFSTYRHLLQNVIILNIIMAILMLCQIVDFRFDSLLLNRKSFLFAAHFMLLPIIIPRLICLVSIKLLDLSVRDQLQYLP